MVRVSTVVMIVGVGLLLVPIPPIATALGILVILLGIGLRLFANV
ncbi:transporter [Natrinema soli]|uniref:Transporter n=1 Tax=Natrinema soli TaxID=1930624 RepID=A0ABD5SFV2_9EURY|nr:transporter [Natrinema soli]